MSVDRNDVLTYLRNFAGDIDRMEICAKRSRMEADREMLTCAWANYSDNGCVSWLALPECDDELTEILRTNLLQVPIIRSGRTRVIPREAEPEDAEMDALRSYTVALREAGLRVDRPAIEMRLVDLARIVELGNLIREKKRGTDPCEPGRWFYINTVLSDPDEYGWIAEIPVDPPFWVPRAEYEELLRLASCPGPAQG